jgi:hypothetical protein
MKITVENKNDKLIEIFCCLEDLAHKPKDVKPLYSLKNSEDMKNLYLNEEDRELYVDEESLFHALLSNKYFI